MIPIEIDGWKLTVGNIRWSILVIRYYFFAPSWKYFQVELFPPILYFWSCVTEVLRVFCYHLPANWSHLSLVEFRHCKTNFLGLLFLYLEMFVKCGCRFLRFFSNWLFKIIWKYYKRISRLLDNRPVLGFLLQDLQVPLSHTSQNKFLTWKKKEKMKKIIQLSSEILICYTIQIRLEL